MSVLLVEDDESIRSCLADLLADAGLRVTSVGSAQEALGIIGGECPSVLLADLRLGPGMNGFTLIAAARQRWPGIRCVLMSGDLDAAQKSAEAPDLFLSKPFRAAELLQALCGGVAG
ncbi:MAG: response regulator [Acetobacteraceae bacterium]|nr:response regulator [Acetobacteraceae bacterium]